MSRRHPHAQDGEQRDHCSDHMSKRHAIADYQDTLDINLALAIGTAHGRPRGWPGSPAPGGWRRGASPRPSPPAGMVDTSRLGVSELQIMAAYLASRVRDQGQRPAQDAVEQRHAGHLHQARPAARPRPAPPQAPLHRRPAMGAGRLPARRRGVPPAPHRGSLRAVAELPEPELRLLYDSTEIIDVGVATQQRRGLPGAAPGLAARGPERALLPRRPRAGRPAPGPRGERTGGDGRPPRADRALQPAVERHRGPATAGGVPRPGRRRRHPHRGW